MPLDDELVLPEEEPLTFGDEPAPGPLAQVNYTGNYEADAKAELNAVQIAFKSRAQEEEKRRLLAIDSEYWLCLCFQTREQKEAFLAGLKLKTDSDKYLDGRLLADKLEIPLPEDPRYKSAKIDPGWFDLSLDF